MSRHRRGGMVRCGWPPPRASHRDEKSLGVYVCVVLRLYFRRAPVLPAVACRSTLVQTRFVSRPQARLPTFGCARSDVPE